MKKKNEFAKDLTAQFETIEQMATAWKAPVVARKKVSEFSGGLLSPKTLANLDYKGEGPKGGFMVGGRKAYPTESLVEFLKDRITLKCDWKPGVQNANK